MFMFLQVFLALVHFIRSGQIYQSEMLFLFVCIFLTAAVIVVLEVGQDAYFRMSVFLTFVFKCHFTAGMDPLSIMATKSTCLF